MANLIKSDDEKNLVRVLDAEESLIIDDDFDCISSYSFAGLNNLKKITFNGNIKKIESKAFFDCPCLDEVVFSESSDVDLSRDFYEKCSSDFKYSKANQPIFKPVSVSDLFDKSFFINDYQRGYRWGKEEVLALLNDISESSVCGENDYYLQPLVLCSNKICSYTKSIKGIYDNNSESDGSSWAYEVIDGQQRLTSTYILMTALELQSKFNIYYKNVRKVDSDFINQAKDIIEKEIKKQKIDTEKLANYCKAHVKFIWYEITDPNVNTKELFRDFNSGKTPLTNSELFRAFLFNRNNFIANASVDEIENRNKELNLISMEWDYIEQSLKNDDFWYFLSNSSYDDKNRMDYILDLYASQQSKLNEGLDERKERYSFNVFVRHFEKLKIEKDSSFEAVKSIWDEHIKDTYDRLYSWYMDTELYNNIGFLIASETKGNSFDDSFVPQKTKDILKLSKEYNRSDFLNKVKQLIKEMFAGIDYNELKYSSPKIKEALLLLNIWETTRNNNISLRFPFDLYKNSFMDKDKNNRIVWNIEHVNAHQLSTDIINNCTKSVMEDFKNSYNPNSQVYKDTLKKRLNEQVKYLIDEFDNPDSIYCKAVTPDSSDLDGLKDFISQPYSTSSQNNLKRCWTNICNLLNEALADDDAPINSISNLALLDEKTNKGYGNSFFKEKRNKIVERDKTSAYIPVCTRNIFLKYYGTNDLFWGSRDMNTIMNELVKPCFEYYKKF